MDQKQQQAILAGGYDSRGQTILWLQGYSEYLESFAFSIAQILNDKEVVNWFDLAGICDQRYYSLMQGRPVPLNTRLLDECELQIQKFLTIQKHENLVDTTVRIQKLRRFAAWGIHELAKQDTMLAPIDDLVQRFVADPNDNARPISSSEAEKLTKWLPQDQIGRPFDGRTVRDYIGIGKKVLEVAANPRSNNTNLLKVAEYLHPLFSQDDRTVDMGFDLHEYMDWYFLDTPAEERVRRAKELSDSWIQPRPKRLGD